MILENDVRSLDKQYIANTYNRFSPVLVRGSGALVYDEHGKEYIDMGTGIGVNAFGYCDPVWAEAVAAQAAKLQHTSNLYYTEPCVKLAKLLCERTGMSKVFFANSGAEANECAIKVARKYFTEQAADHAPGSGVNAGRNVIITLKNSFHGRTLTTLAATGQEHYHELFNPLTPGFAHIEAGDTVALETLIAGGGIAALMVECIQGEGGVVVVDGEWLRTAERIVHDAGGLLIVDEVQTGNGRTGKLYSYMHAGLHPDIVTTAKGLGGGLPIGAAILSAKVGGVLGYGDHGSTFGGNPVCCAGAYSVMSRLDDAFLEGVAEKGAYIADALRRVPGVTGVSGMGLMIGVKTCAPAAEIVKKCAERGLLCLTAKDRVRLLPPLDISAGLLERAVEILAAAIREAERQ